jgi:hypothetical protein
VTLSPPFEPITGATLSAPPFARHCAMFAVDIVAFGSRHDEDVQQHLREALYRIVEEACRIAGLPQAICHREDRGDGLFLIAPSCVSAEVILDPLASHLRAGLRRHNKLASVSAKIQLRMAVHAGQVRFDPHGASGRALIHLFRLLDAPEFKNSFTTAGTEFAVVTSHRLYDDVIQHGPGLIDPSLYRPITIALKETHARGWIWLSPPAAEQPLPAATQPQPPLDLTPGDIEIALLIASDWTPEHLAEVLGTTVHDARIRICRVLAKLCLADPTDIGTTFFDRLQESRLRQHATEPSH